jgi:hypothetical protein
MQRLRQRLGLCLRFEKMGIFIHYPRLNNVEWKNAVEIAK